MFQRHILCLVCFFFVEGAGVPRCSSWHPCGKFWKVSAIVYLLYRVTIASVFENVYVMCNVSCGKYSKPINNLNNLLYNAAFKYSKHRNNLLYSVGCEHVYLSAPLALFTRFQVDPPLIIFLIVFDPLPQKKNSRKSGPKCIFYKSQ